MRTKKTIEERIAADRAKAAQLEARARKNEAIKRKTETAAFKRKAFLVGETVLLANDLPDYFRDTLAAILDDAMKTDGDRTAVADLMEKNRLRRAG